MALEDRDELFAEIEKEYEETTKERKDKLRTAIHDIKKVKCSILEAGDGYKCDVLSGGKLSYFQKCMRDTLKGQYGGRPGIMRGRFRDAAMRCSRGGARHIYYKSLDKNIYGEVIDPDDTRKEDTFFVNSIDYWKGFVNKFKADRDGFVINPAKDSFVWFDEEKEVLHISRMFPYLRKLKKEIGM